jgi:hypothetical protein
MDVLVFAIFFVIKYFYGNSSVCSKLFIVSVSYNTFNDKFSFDVPGKFYCQPQAKAKAKAMPGWLYIQTAINNKNTFVSQKGLS